MNVSSLRSFWPSPTPAPLPAVPSLPSIPHQIAGAKRKGKGRDETPSATKGSIEPKSKRGQLGRSVALSPVQPSDIGKVKRITRTAVQAGTAVLPDTPLPVAVAPPAKYRIESAVFEVEDKQHSEGWSYMIVQCTSSKSKTRMSCVEALR